MLAEAVARPIDERDERIGIDGVEGIVEHSLGDELVGSREDVGAHVRAVDANAYSSALRDRDVIIEARLLLGDEVVLDGEAHRDGNGRVEPHRLAENSGRPPELFNNVNVRNRLRSDILPKHRLGLLDELLLDIWVAHDLIGSPREERRARLVPREQHRLDVVAQLPHCSLRHLCALTHDLVHNVLLADGPIGRLLLALLPPAADSIA